MLPLSKYIAYLELQNSHKLCNATVRLVGQDMLCQEIHYKLLPTDIGYRYWLHVAIYIEYSSLSSVTWSDQPFQS